MAETLFPPLKDDIDKETLKAIPDDDMRDILTTGKTDYEDFENNLLDEYSDKSSFEPYSGIVLDPEDNMFKTVSGMFRDKKDFYEKLSKRGYVVRKVFEKKVFDWIERNAKNNIEAYLMFSTAFSKWKGNNLLNSYYTKLLNDIPQLNREKIKGDPNSIGDNQKEESVLEEDHEKVNLNGYADRPEYPVTVVPVFTTPDKTVSIRENDPNWPVYTTNARFNMYPGCTVTNYLTSDPEFIRTLFQQTDDRNPKAVFRKSKYPKDSGIDYPNGFAFKIGNTYLKHNQFDRTVGNKNGGIAVLDGQFPKYILKRSAIQQWNDNLSKYRSQLDVNQQNIQRYASNSAEDKANELMFSDMGNLETALAAQDIVDTDVTKAKDTMKNVQRNDTVSLMKSSNWENRVSKEDRKTLDMFDEQIRILSNSSKEDPNFRMIMMAYNADEPKELDKVGIIHKIKKLKQDFLQTVEVYQSRLEKVNAAIDAVEVQLQNVYSKAGTSTNDAVIQKMNLETKLNNLKDLQKRLIKQKRESLKINNLIEPDEDNISITNTSNINKGYKSKFTRSQADMNVGKGIHGNKSESSWKSMVNSLKEDYNCFHDGIPRVDDTQPGRHVNYNANIGYVDFPTTGVITSPGAFNTGGTFMTEQDEHWGWVHDELNQELFDGTHLRPDVREALLKIAEKFKNTLAINLDPVDIYFTGSSANFNYNDTSDLDLHLVYDFEQIGINAEILVKYFIAKKQVFNNDYSIEVKGIPVEVGVENLNEPIVSSAVYSVVQDKWLIEPEYAEQLLPRPDMKQYYDIVQKIESTIETRDSTKIGKLWDELYEIRKESLKTEGEYGKGNALFKKLRSLGYLDRLKKAYYSSASDELSLEALKEI